MAERRTFLARLDPAIHDAVARWAEDELRSTNQEIEFLLRQAIADRPPDERPTNPTSEQRPEPTNPSA